MLPGSTTGKGLIATVTVAVAVLQPPDKDAVTEYVVVTNGDTVKLDPTILPGLVVYVNPPDKVIVETFPEHTDVGFDTAETVPLALAVKEIITKPLPELMPDDVTPAVTPPTKEEPPAPL